MISRTIVELTKAFSKVGIRYKVSIFLFIEEFAYPICSSNSKSDTALRPLIIVFISKSIAKSFVHDRTLAFLIHFLQQQLQLHQKY